jgi:K+-transporting ATPase KdpF subunit
LPLSTLAFVKRHNREEFAMFDLILSAAVSLGLFGYLLLALLKPERF